MNCDFSWPTALWEADSAASFNTIVAADTALSPSHSFPDALGQLLSNSISDSIQLSVEHLLMLIYGLLPPTSLQFSTTNIYSNKHPRLPSSRRPPRIPPTEEHFQRRPKLEEDLGRHCFFTRHRAIPPSGLPTARGGALATGFCDAGYGYEG